MSWFKHNIIECLLILKPYFFVLRGPAMCKHLRIYMSNFISNVHIKTDATEYTDHHREGTFLC